MTDMPEVSFTPYTGPSGGWGSARSVGNILRRENAPASVGLALTRQNKVDGFQCVSCAWSKPANPLAFEFCENGAKATAWELTVRRCGPEFFAGHTVAELLTWPDYNLEQEGRLTEPMRYDPVRETYVAVSWAEAFAEIGGVLRALPDRRRAVFYSSGRCSNEASYMYALFARLYGNNNLPDSSNMCHETTSVALPESIGVPVGTTTLDDFAHTDCILFFGQNPGTNSPRMLHPLQAASRRGVPIITFNPLRERGLERFTNPQSPTEMLGHVETRISSQYHQVKVAGDIAAITGVCKALLELDAERRAAGQGAVLDDVFIAAHTHGFQDFVDWVNEQPWDAIERESGLSRAELQSTAHVYARAETAMAVYGMGLTQHVAGVQAIRMVVNLLLMRGNIGKQGAGICPVRGHSNVQGQRTVGITEKPELVPLDRLAAQYGFEPPRETGLNTVETCEAVLAGAVDAFVGFGGNFVRAIPDRDRMEPAWRRIGLTVHVATKLNRSHLVPGKISYLLPVIGRTERDQQASGAQCLSMEDSMACIHGSKGVRAPASPHLLSEPAVVAALAMATLPPNPNVPWQAWVDDYSLVRAAITKTFPEIFHDYERRMWEPGGFHRKLPARERKWNTKTGKANFVVPKGLDGGAKLPNAGSDAVRLITMRSNDQFNTTVYGYDDRFRGIRGTRRVVLMNVDDVARFDLKEGDVVKLSTASDDGFVRELDGLRVTTYNIPPGCVGAYFPEANVLLPVSHYAEGSKTPAAKSVPVRIAKTQTEWRAESDRRPAAPPHPVPPRPLARPAAE